MKNYYSILGIRKDATKEEISKAYRQLALKFHPDKNNGPKVLSKFQEINEAKEILSDEGKRIEYEEHFNSVHYTYNKEFKGSVLAYENNNGKLKKLFFVSGLIIAIGLGLFFMMVKAKNSKNDTANFTMVSQPENTEKLAHNNKLPNDKDVEEMAQMHENILDKENLLPPTIAEEKTPTKEIPEDIITINSGSPKKDLITESNAVLNDKTTDVNTNNNPHNDLSEDAMEAFLVRLKGEKRNLNNSSNCIQIRKTKTSNIDNAFDLATFLSNNGYIISGRQIVSNEVNGIAIDANENCIIITIGKM